MKRNVASGIIYIVIGVVIVLFAFQYFQYKGTSKHPLITEVTNDLSGIDTLIIESSVTAIHITETNDSVFSAHLEQSTSSPFTLLANVSSNKLTLEVAKQKPNFPFINLNDIGKKVFGSKLLIQIPKHYNGNLNISTATGSTEIQNLNLKAIKLESTTGSVKLNNTKSNHIKLESTTGSIHVNDVMTDSLEAESTTGSIHLNNNSIAAFDVESTTGSIHVSQDDILKGSKLSSTTGSVHVSLNNAPTSLNVTFETATGKPHIKKTGYNMIQNSRDKYEFQFGSGETSLKVETSTGSFHFE